MGEVGCLMGLGWFLDFYKNGCVIFGLRVGRRVFEIWKVCGRLGGIGLG